MNNPMQPFSVDITENLWIPLADGTRLAARLWLPRDAGPVPAILEYIPYRKRDGTRGRDEPMHGFFAAQGYAAIRVDMRGSGESDGLLDDEYLAAGAGRRTARSSPGSQRSRGVRVRLA